MSFGSFLGGVVVLLAVVGPVVLAARRIRRLVVLGPPLLALLADIVLTLGLVVLAGEAAGTVGQFTRVGLILASTLTLAIVRLVVPSAPLAAAEVDYELSEQHLSRWVLAMAVAVIVVVVLQWTSHTFFSFSHGVIDFDSRMYHLPIAAQFAQDGHTSHLALLDPHAGAAYHTENTELLHALGMVAFRRDLLSPVLNLGWLALALSCAWCAGKKYNVSPLCAAAVSTVVSLPVLAATNSGTAGNDIAPIALLLAATVFLIYDAGGRTAVVSGLAAGLAIGSKENALAIAAALLVLAVVTVPRGRRWSVGLIWSVAAMAGGGYWFVRNFIRTGNPVPTIRLGVGSLHLPGPHMPFLDENDHSAAAYLGNEHVLRNVFVPALRSAFGDGWVLLLLGLTVALFVAVVHRGLPRRLAAVAVVGIAAYFVTPLTALGPPGRPSPLIVALNFRFMTAGLALAALTGSLAVARSPRACAFSICAIMGTVLLTLASSGGFPAWQPSESGREILLTALAISVLFGLVTLLATARADVSLSPHARRVLMALVSIASLVAGPYLARAYLDRRYRSNVLVDPVVATAGRAIKDQRIGIVGLQRSYPLYGPTLANRVLYIGRSLPHGGLVDISSCPEWRRAVNKGNFDYVLVAPPDAAQATAPVPPASTWTETAQGASLIAQRGKTKIYRIDSVLDPAACPGAS